MTFKPTTDVVVTIARPASSPFTERIRSESVQLSLDGVTWGASVTLIFNAANWNVGRTVFVRAIDDLSSEGELIVPLQALVVGQISGNIVSAAGATVTVAAGALTGQSLSARRSRSPAPA